jgi:adenylylsulfate kinase-like enzyme
VNYGLTRSCKKSCSGHIENLAGSASSYEEPGNFDVVVEADLEDIEVSVNEILAILKK